MTMIMILPKAQTTKASVCKLKELYKILKKYPKIVEKT